MYSLCSNAHLSEVDGESVVVDTVRGLYYSLNSTGTSFLRSVLGGATPQQSAQQMSELFEVAPDQALADGMELLGQLESQGLLVREG